jgi:hypothetical protein
MTTRRTPLIEDDTEKIPHAPKGLEEISEEDLARRSRDKAIKKYAELTAGEYAIQLPYHPQETLCDIEELEKLRMKVAPDGDKKETSQEKATSDLEHMKIFFEYIIRKQNERVQSRKKSSSR